MVSRNDKVEIENARFNALEPPSYEENLNLRRAPLSSQ